MTLFLLIVGFIFLIKGADLFVDGSSALAKIFRIPSVIIGLTIVAMGTSAPEASVSINAALTGNNAIAISNVVGSNIFNLLIVVGICATMMPFVVNKDILRRDLPVNIFITVLLLILSLDGKLNRIEGIILLIGIILYILFMIHSAIQNKTSENADKVNPLPLYKCILFILIGLGIIILGGNLVVNNASKIALSLGLSQNFIGLTIVAIGTSLPELVTSIVATRKNESALALGNAVGSNIFNILFILGASVAISPLSVISESIIDGIILVVISVIMLIFAKTKGKLERKEGIICIIIYLAYLAYILCR